VNSAAVRSLEMRRFSCRLPAIVASRNGTEGSNFHIWNTVIATINCLTTGSSVASLPMTARRCSPRDQPCPQRSSSFPNIKHATSTAWDGEVWYSWHALCPPTNLSRPVLYTSNGFPNQGSLHVRLKIYLFHNRRFASMFHVRPNCFHMANCSNIIEELWYE
jgi:hypothetical protein